MNTLKIGDSGLLVLQLQMFLNINGFIIAMDSSFGGNTKNAVAGFQCAHKMTPTGIADAQILDLISKPTLIDKWCLSIKDMEGYIAPCNSYPSGTPAWRNHNPGNLRSSDFTTRSGAYTKDKSGFAVFPDYQTGYNALKILLIRACTGQSSVYNPQMTLIEFYNLYSPSSDNNDPLGYAKKVANDLGVPVDTQIKNLLV